MESVSHRKANAVAISLNEVSKVAKFMETEVERLLYQGMEGGRVGEQRTCYLMGIEFQMCKMKFWRFVSQHWVYT